LEGIDVARIDSYGSGEEARGMTALADMFERRSDDIALVDDTGEVTYRKLAEMADAFAERIGGNKSLVFLEARNTVESIAAYLGCVKYGHPVHLFSEKDGEKLGPLARRYLPNFIWHWRNGVFEEERPHREPHELHPYLCVLLSTSGSTGSPKFVKLSRNNIRSNAQSICEYLRLDASERALTGLRFNYSYGMSVLNSHLLCGASLALTDLSVGEREFWDLFRKVGGTSFAGVPYSFELLSRSAFPWAETPGLRYATQAGGRLSVDLVRHVARLGSDNGWQFYVMYGQTEASPRIAYLPPEHAQDYPNCIGVPIPGGEIQLLGEEGNIILETDRPGELSYRGPNVMMGYASDVAGLATDHTPDRLRTDDIACRNSAGLYYIVGRKSRFIKPFGVRVNLDEVQEHVRSWFPGSACAGDDEKIVVAIPANDAPIDRSAITAQLASLYNLPPYMFSIRVVDQLPLLDTGKVDYKRLLDSDRGRKVEAAASRSNQHWLGVLLSPEFYRQAGFEVSKILGLAKDEWDDVADIYRTLIGTQEVDGDSTFSSLAGDSLTFVQTYLALESYLGTVPGDWEHKTVDELERLRAHELVP
jgi:acyl-CoA synthetase (AMP-forming)/AMP-acid ligase II